MAGEDDGHQVGQRLANAGPRLDDGVLRVGDALGNQVGHGELLGALLIARDPAGDQAAGGQHVLDAQVGPFGLGFGF